MRKTKRDASDAIDSKSGPPIDNEPYFPDEILDLSTLSQAEQKSKMYRNLLTVFSMCANKPMKYEEANDYMHSLYGKFTGSKTTCVYWRDTLLKENIPTSCNDPTCQEKNEPHRICKRTFYRKTKVIWVQRDLAKQIFKEYTPSWEQEHE